MALVTIYYLKIILLTNTTFIRINRFSNLILSFDPEKYFFWNCWKIRPRRINSRKILEMIGPFTKFI